MKNLVAILVGLAVMAVGRELLVAALPYALGAFPGDHAQQLLGGAITSPVALSALLVVTGVTTLFGAWLTARLSPDHHAGHAVFTAVIWLAVLVFRGALDWHRVPFWVHVTTWVLVPAAALLAGRAWERTRARGASGRVPFGAGKVTAAR